MKTSLVQVSLLLLSLVACTQRPTSSRPTIKYVEDILASKTGTEISLLKRAGKQIPNADIVLIGEETNNIKIAEQLANYDAHDNVSGTQLIDGLPDFAGETITCISYRKDAEISRELTVRYVLAALDTVAHISPYDTHGGASKKSAKFIILTDPNLSNDGGFDIDTLFRSTACQIPVLSPVDFMLDKLISGSASQQVNLGILSDSLQLASGVYFDLFKKKMAEHNAYGSCIAVPSDSKDSLIYKMLHRHVSGGGSKPIDALIVDDVEIDTDSLKLELAGIVSVMNESSMTYGKYISPTFEIYDSFNGLAQTCFDNLRNNNLFTHNISKPQVLVYNPFKRPNSTDGSIILIPAFYVQ